MLLTATACGPSLDLSSEAARTAVRELRVCADPNNMPFSNDREEGFENRLASLLGEELEATVRYTWWSRAGVHLTVTPVQPEIDLPFLPFVFDIALGVRRDDVALRDDLDAILARRADDVNALLRDFGVPAAASSF